MIKTDVIVIGGGLMGASTAFWLARKGRRVLILEKETSPCHASAVNAGGVRRLNRAVEEIPLSLGAMELWPNLDAIIGNDCGFERAGQVRIAPDQAAMEVFEKRLNRLTRLGYTHEEMITAAEVNRLVPAYQGPCSGALVSRDDGHAQPARTLKAFFNAALKAGAECVRQCSATGIIPKETGFCVTAGGNRSFYAGAVVNCAGAWGARIASLAGDRLPMEPVGLAMMVTSRMPRFIKPVVGVHGRKLSFKQMANGTVVIGGAHRAALDMRTETTVIDFAEMRQSARTVMEHFPIMRRASVVRCWAGIEGMMQDGLPVIGESPSTPGLFHVCGFSSHGFQLSPMVGRLAAALVLGKTPEISLKAFSVNRFSR